MLNWQSPPLIGLIQVPGCHLIGCDIVREVIYVANEEQTSFN